MCSREPEFPHTINRKTIFKDISDLFQQEGTLNPNDPLRVKFNNEKALYCDGVCRDVFSAYWEEAYKLF